MYYQEKRIVTTILSSVLVLLIYCIYAITAYRNFGTPLLDDLVFWSKTMLIFIGIQIIASIVILVLFHILLSVSIEVKKELGRESTDLELDIVEDEMDRLIEQKSTKYPYIFVGVGFAIALLSAYWGRPVAIMMNIIFIAFLSASILEGAIQLYYYKKGIQNV